MKLKVHSALTGFAATAVLLPALALAADDKPKLDTGDTAWRAATFRLRTIYRSFDSAAASHRKAFAAMPAGTVCPPSNSSKFTS